MRGLYTVREYKCFVCDWLCLLPLAIQWFSRFYSLVFGYHWFRWLNYRHWTYIPCLSLYIEKIKRQAFQSLVWPLLQVHFREFGFLIRNISNSLQVGYKKSWYNLDHNICLFVFWFVIQEGRFFFVSHYLCIFRGLQHCILSTENIVFSDSVG